MVQVKLYVTCPNLYLNQTPLQRYLGTAQQSWGDIIDYLIRAQIYLLK